MTLVQCMTTKRNYWQLFCPLQCWLGNIKMLSTDVYLFVTIVLFNIFVNPIKLHPCRMCILSFLTSYLQCIVSIYNAHLKTWICKVNQKWRTELDFWLQTIKHWSPHSRSLWALYREFLAVCYFCTIFTWGLFSSHDQTSYCYYYYNRFTALCVGLPGWAGTRRMNHSGYYWTRDDGVAVASAGPYASHLHFGWYGNDMLRCWFLWTV